MAFGGGRHTQSVLDGLKRFDRLLCVSDYLRELVKNLTDIDADVIPYGPNALEFYPVKAKRQKAVAIQFSGRADKGSDLAAIAVPSLLNAGFDVTAFGAETVQIDFPVKLKFVGQIAPVALRALFSRVEFYVDLSRYEGLGMLSLEATFCGAVPVFLRNGGTARELARLTAGIPLHTIDELHLLGPRLDAERNTLERFAAGRAQVVQSYNLKHAVDTFVEKLHD